MAQSIDWEALASISALLPGLPESARRSARLIEIAKGHTLFEQGHAPRWMHCVIAGEVRLLRRSRDGGEIVLQRARAGFIAEASLDQKRYHCYAIAATAAVVLVIQRKALIEALDDPAFRNSWIAHLASELRKARAQNERLSMHTARQRIIHFIETEGEDGVVTLTESKKAWAVGLGLTHEALYRALAGMRRTGHLVVDGPRLQLALSGARG